MSPAVFVVTGTDTGVGKTVVSAAVVAVAMAAGLRVAYVKPAQTGVLPGEPGDAEEVRRLTGLDDLHELARLPEPLAPRTAARRAGAPLPSVEDVAGYVSSLRGRDVIVVEGAGGLLVQLDHDGATVADLSRRLVASVLVVVHPGLGTLSATALTCLHLRCQGLVCAGVVVGAWPERPGLAERSNMLDLPDYAGAPLLGSLPAQLGRCSRATFTAQVSEHLAAGLASVPGWPRRVGHHDEES